MKNIFILSILFLATIANAQVIKIGGDCTNDQDVDPTNELGSFGLNGTGDSIIYEDEGGRYAVDANGNPITSVTRANDTITVVDNGVTLSAKAGLEVHTNTTLPINPHDGYTIYNSDIKQGMYYDSKRAKWIRTDWHDGHAIVRYLPTTESWEVLDDISHTPYGDVSVASSPTGNGFVLTTDNSSGSTGRKLGIVIVAPDETISRKAMYAGPSFGVNTIDVSIIKIGGFSLRCNGTGTIINSNDFYPDDLTLTWDAVNLELYVNHPSSGIGVGGAQGVQGTQDYSVVATPSTGSNFAYVKQVPGWTTYSGTKISFYDALGNKTTPTGEWYFSRNASWGPRNNVLDKAFGLGTKGNFWIFWRYIED